MPKEDKKDKKPEDKKGTDNWGKDFKGKVVYDKDGVRVLQSTDSSIPFKVVLLADGTKKILPPKADIKTVDPKTLPDLDETDLNKNITASQSYGAPVIDEKAMTDWNNMTSWLKDKGYAGDPRMNNVEYSKKAFNEYKAANPESSLTYDHVLPVQQLMHQYRQKSLDEIKKGTTEVSGILPDASNYMRHVATDLGKKDDGILGQETSTFVIPTVHLTKYDENNQTEGRKRLGFAPNQPDATVAAALPAKPPIKRGEGLFLNNQRVAEMFPVDKDKSRLVFNDTGEEAEVLNSELYNPIALGSSNAFPSERVYNQFKAKVKKPEPVTATTQK